MGAPPESPLRAIEALKVIARLKDQVEIITYPHEMGEDEARAAGFDPRVIVYQSGATIAEDTMQAAKEMAAAGV
jgi:predicted polyphosphate/ATP-dependent NAD kinase